MAKQFEDNPVLQEIYDRMAPEDKELLEAIHAKRQGKSTQEEVVALVKRQTREKAQYDQV
jgi:hypothetical protein